MKLRSYYFVSFIVLLVMCSIGCAEAGGNRASQNADPTGYYDVSGKAVVKEKDNKTPLIISDLEAMAYGHRLMMLSARHDLLYDITITSISGKHFTGTARIYDSSGANQVVTNATVSGDISAGSSITGTLSGSGVGNGRFKLSYSTQKNILPTRQTDWMSPIGRSSAEYVFVIINAHTFARVLMVKNGYFSDCAMTGKVSALVGTGLYSVSVSISGCEDTSVDGLYTGFIAPQDPQSIMLVFAITHSDGSHSVSGDFHQPAL